MPGLGENLLGRPCIAGGRCFALSSFEHVRIGEPYGQIGPTSPNSKPYLAGRRASKGLRLGSQASEGVTSRKSPPNRYDDGRQTQHYRANHPLLTGRPDIPILNMNSGSY